MPDIAASTLINRLEEERASLMPDLTTELEEQLALAKKIITKAETYECRDPELIAFNKGRARELRIALRALYDSEAQE